MVKDTHSTDPYIADAEIDQSLDEALRTYSNHRPREVERKALALFVMVLPVIYLTRANGEWLWIEGAGMVVFGACAVLGLLRSPW